MPESSDRRNTSVTFFKKDDDIINRIIAKGLTFGIRLKVSEVIRLLFHLADPEKIPEEAFRAAKERHAPLQRKKVAKAPRR